MAGAVAEVHGRANAPANAVLHGTITVEFGGNTLLDAADIWFHPNGGLVRIDAGDGDVAVFDGQTAWANEQGTLARPRFQLLTWPYFAVMPFKLDDGGTRLEGMDDAPLRAGEAPMRRMKLTFGEGVGDSPDDWYVLYVDDDDQLVASGYIVTYGKSVDAAEAEPHAIVYKNFTDVPGPDGEPTGVVLSPTWEFYNWTEADGITGDVIGRVSIDGLALVETPDGVFERPEGTEEVTPPSAE